MSKTLSLVVLISGNGSNLQSIIDQIELGQLDAKIVAVISNRPDAHGLTRACLHNIPGMILDHADFASREAFDEQLQRLLEPLQPDYILLAGFMRILGSAFIQAYADKILNIHPSLLPAYKGLGTYRRAMEQGESEHGVSIHLVTAQLDDGPVLLQGRYPIEAGDSVEDLQYKGHQLEHRMYPQLLRWLSEGKLKIGGGHIIYGQAELENPIEYEY